MKGVDVFSSLIEGTPAPTKEGASKDGRAQGEEFDALLAEAVEGESRPVVQAKAGAPLAREQPPGVLTQGAPPAGAAAGPTSRAARGLDTAALAPNQRVPLTPEGKPVSPDRAIELPQPVRSIHDSISQASARTSRAPLNDKPGANSAVAAQDAQLDRGPTTAPREGMAADAAPKQATTDADESDDVGEVAPEAQLQPDHPAALQAVLERVATVIARIVAPLERASAAALDGTTTSPLDLSVSTAGQEAQDGPVLGAQVGTGRTGPSEAEASAWSSAQQFAGGPASTVPHASAYESPVAGAAHASVATGAPAAASPEAGSKMSPNGIAHGPSDSTSVSSPRAESSTRRDVQAPAGQTSFEPSQGVSLEQLPTRVAGALGSEHAGAARSVPQAAAAGQAVAGGAPTVEGTPPLSGTPASTGERVRTAVSVPTGQRAPLGVSAAAAASAPVGAREPDRMSDVRAAVSASAPIGERVSVGESASVGATASAGAGVATGPVPVVGNASVDSTQISPAEVAVPARSFAAAAPGPAIGSAKAAASASTAAASGARSPRTDALPSNAALVEPGLGTTAPAAAVVASSESATSTPAGKPVPTDPRAPRAQAALGTADAATANAPMAAGAVAPVVRAQNLTVPASVLPALEGGSEPARTGMRKTGDEPLERIHGFTRGALVGQAMSAYSGRGHEGAEHDSPARGRRSEERETTNESASFADRLAPQAELPTVVQAHAPTPEAPALPVATPQPAAPAAAPVMAPPDVEFVGRPPSAQTQDASISLHHPDLGPIQLEVHREQGRVEVHAILDSAHAEAVLRANESGIRQGVQQSGMTFSALRLRVRGEEPGAARAVQVRQRQQGQAGQIRKRRVNERET